MGNKTLGWHEDCPAAADDLLPEAERSGVKEVDIKAGDTIFLQTDNLWWFSQNLNHQVNKPFILVTGNSDKPTSFTGAAHDILKSPLLIAWFAQNLDFIHPKIKPIPIGLENRQYNGLGQPSKIAEVLQPIVPIYLPGGRADE